MPGYADFAVLLHCRGEWKVMVTCYEVWRIMLLEKYIELSMWT